MFLGDLRQAEAHYRDAPDVPLTSSGRNLDNYLYPLVKRLGATRFSAVFGRKFHGSS